MKVLIACEESQEVMKAFRNLGHDAWSCDILSCSGGYPQWHIKGDAIKESYSGKYDLMVAHPPCTYLAVSGARWMYNKDGSINKDRYEKQKEAIFFVKQLMDAPIKHIALENPVSVISSKIRKPDDIIQPYMFGDKASKTTCLWLKNLPKLNPTNIVEKGEFFEWIDKNGKKKRQAKWYMDALSKAKTSAERRSLRSKTFKGIAEAMAEQYSNYILQNK